jgi:hypothetical protein
MELSRALPRGESYPVVVIRPPTQISRSDLGHAYLGFPKVSDDPNSVASILDQMPFDADRFSTLTRYSQHQQKRLKTPVSEMPILQPRQGMETRQLRHYTCQE